MKLKIYRLEPESYLAATDDKDFKPGDYYLNFYVSGKPADVRMVHHVKGDRVYDGDLKWRDDECATSDGLYSIKKVIAVDETFYSDVNLPKFELENSINDVHKLGCLSAFSNGYNSETPENIEKFYDGINDYLDGFKNGYLKSENIKYTIEDIEAAFHAGVKFGRDIMNNPSNSEYRESLERKLNLIEIDVATEQMNIDEIREAGKGFLNTNTNKLVKKDGYLIVNQYIYE